MHPETAIGRILRAVRPHLESGDLDDLAGALKASLLHPYTAALAWVDRYHASNQREAPNRCGDDDAFLERLRAHVAVLRDAIDAAVGEASASSTAAEPRETSAGLVLKLSAEDRAAFAELADWAKRCHERDAALGATDDQFEELAADLTETLVKLDAEVEALRKRVAELEAQIARDKVGFRETLWW